MMWYEYLFTICVLSHQKQCNFSEIAVVSVRTKPIPPLKYISREPTRSRINKFSFSLSREFRACISVGSAHNQSAVLRTIFPYTAKYAFRASTLWIRQNRNAIRHYLQTTDSAINNWNNNWYTLKKYKIKFGIKKTSL